MIIPFRIFIFCCIVLIFTARKRSLRRLCFYTCVSVHGRGYLLRGRGPFPGVPAPGEVGCVETPLPVKATVASGTHPTGMHSCFLCNSTLRFYFIITYPRHIVSFKTIEPPQYETTVETSVDHSQFCECSSGHSLLIADMLVHQPKPFEFSLNVFTDSTEFSNKNNLSLQ